MNYTQARLAGLAMAASIYEYVSPPDRADELALNTVAALALDPELDAVEYCADRVRYHMAVMGLECSDEAMTAALMARAWLGCVREEAA